MENKSFDFTFYPTVSSVSEEDNQNYYAAKVSTAQIEKVYQMAVELMGNAQDAATYAIAQDTFKAIVGYRDSSALAQECQRKIDALETPDSPKLVKKRESISVPKMAKLAALVACLIIGIFAVKTLTPNILPNNGNKVANSGKTSLNKDGSIEGEDVLLSTGDGAESPDGDSSANGDKAENPAEKIQIGDTYVFGIYEQDADESNGKEDIKWIVLDKEESNILLISKEGLECLPYHEEWEDVTWEQCKLRKWLNEEFYQNAFSADEQGRIQKVNLKNPDNPKYATPGGNDTEDQVFLLSIADFQKYFKDDSARQCTPTAYAKKKVAYVDKVIGNCSWWLRSPGLMSNCAAFASPGGSVIIYGYAVDRDDFVVRPALWINLES